MDEMAIPFWEAIYQKDNVMAFSATPNQTIKEFENLLTKDSNILEVGCGEGQNVLYMAQQGYYNIDAFDISESGIRKLKRLCDMRRLNINAFVQDLTSFRFVKKYDCVMSFATLCFVNTSDWKRFIEKAKTNTNIGGIHIMHIFTDAVLASVDIAPFAIGLAKDGEIKEMYKDWEILQFKSYVFEDEHPNVPKHMHSVNKIVARKVDV